MNPSITEWKGQEIIDFQEELRMKVNARISEKWFYTHMRASHPSLPRIDMLNFLCKYAGYANWDDFIFRNKFLEFSKIKPHNPNRYFILIPLIAVGIVVLFFILFKFFNTVDYRFTFVDADTRETIKSDQTEIILLAGGESAIHSLVGRDGKYRLKTDESVIRMVVNAPYYRPDTIERIVTKLNREEFVFLKPDDYSLMIHYFSTMKVDDWEKRRSKLNDILSDSVVVFQVIKDKESSGIVLYNKQEFVDKLTTPSGNLKNIEILDSKSSKGKIQTLRFRINEKKK
jgi:hypothetical protein